MPIRIAAQVALSMVVLTAASASGQQPAVIVSPIETERIVPASSGAYAWRGREQEIEDFLRSAPITQFKDIPVGITKPRRGYFAPGGPASSMAWKPLHDQVMNGRMESYRSEIAAYLLSRHLGLDLVPPVVEREINGVKGAVVYWIDGVRPWDPKSPPKAPALIWSRQMSRMFMFDQLIANIDRNQGNLLYGEGGHAYLIDHSRAFTPRSSLSGLHAPQQYDRALWLRMAALTRDDLDVVLGRWLTSSQRDALLKRRDRMARQIDKLVRAQGDQVAFLPQVVETPLTSSD